VPDLDRPAPTAKTERPGRSARGDRQAKADLSRRSAAEVQRAKADRRFAWWLVWLYPPAFRRDVGLGLVDALDDRMRARRAAGASTAGVRLPAIADTVHNAPVEWIAAWRAFHPQPRQPSSRKRTMIDTVMQDVRYALRLWRRRPTFAAIAILTLALGVGANTAMFSIVNAVLLRPLPYAHADRLITVYTKSKNFRQGLVSYLEYEEIRRQSGSIEAIALFLGQSVNITGSNEPQRLVGTFATGTFFDVLGLKAERGHLFSEEDSAPGTVKPVVVLSDHLWQQRYNRDPSAIGRTLTVNGTPLTIVGVMEPPYEATQ
jgi:MacB-like protein